MAASLVAAWLTAAGCYAYRPALGDAPPRVTLPAEAWPEASTDRVAALAEGTPEVIRELEPDPEVTDDIDAGRVQFLIDDATWHVNQVRLDEHGLLRTWDGPGARADQESLAYIINGFVPDGAYITDAAVRYALARREAAATTRDGDFWSRARLAAAITPGLRVTNDRPDRWLLRKGIAVRIADVTGDERGIVVHFPAMFGNEYEQEVIDRLAAAGWAIVHVASETRLRDPNGAERDRAMNKRVARTAVLFEEQAGPIATVADLPSEERMRRLETWTEARRQAAEEIPMPDSGFALHPDGDPASTGRLLAGIMDEHLAEHARAVQAVLGLFDEMHPALADKPIVVLGFSAGALTAPAAAAGLTATHGERLAGLVLVGGGGDLVSIALASDISDGGIELEPSDGPAPEPARVQRMHAAYVESAQLDPLAVAAALRDLPVLHVYASKDTTVPTTAAIAFNQAHGHVDRLVHSGGHGGLFYFLPGQAGRIERWMNEVSSADP